MPLFFQQFFEHEPHYRVLRQTRGTTTSLRYMAAVSFADANSESSWARWIGPTPGTNTTLVLWSDHGYHLGDKEHWGKFTHWEQGTNAPLIIVDPDVGRPGTVVRTPVSLLDLFPTLVDLTGIDDPLRRDGHSLVPLLRHPNARVGPFRRQHLRGLDLAAHRTVPLHRLARRIGAALRHGPRPRPVGEPGRGPRPQGSSSGCATGGRDEVERLGGRMDFLHERIAGTGATRPSSCRRTSKPRSAATATTPTSRSRLGDRERPGAAVSTP